MCICYLGNMQTCVADVLPAILIKVVVSEVWNREITGCFWFYWRIEGK
jgi:hypothetical protein